MDNSENTFPMDVTDPTSRPWKFRPEGFLVVILASGEEAEREDRTCCPRVRRTRHQALHPGNQILDNQMEYIGRRGPHEQVVSPSSKTWRAESCISATRVMIAARCGYASRTSTWSRGPFESSPTTTTFTRATTAPGNRPTTTSPDRTFARLCYARFTPRLDGWRKSTSSFWTFSAWPSRGDRPTPRLTR